ncbi:MAG: hypothetical protein IK089_07160 [Oxalobacter sp.]|nr:hypothetical protein [Oxalobacter sp.]MBR6001013.1 hypothetical protein [Oxalobacter sp.]
MENLNQTPTVIREAQEINKALTQRLNTSQTTSDEEFKALLHAVTVPMMTLTAKLSGESEAFVQDVCDEVLKQLTGKEPQRDDSGRIQSARSGQPMDATALFESTMTDPDMIKGAEIANRALAAAMKEMADTHWGRPVIRARIMVMVIVGILNRIGMEANHPLDHFDTVRDAMQNIQSNMGWK